MLKHLKNLCMLFGVSGREDDVREYIVSNLPNDCTYTVDPLGNLIVEKHGKNRSAKKVMLDAHMDEVGFIISGITREGLLQFTTVGGMSGTAIIGKRVVLENGLYGVITSKPIHMMDEDERKEKPSVDKLYIDIGASDISEANKYIRPGDTAVFDCEYSEIDEKIIAKALDDRAGCVVLLDLLNKYDEYDYTAVFAVQEEVGCRGAKTAAYTVCPDIAIALDSTTASDINGISGAERVCGMGDGVVIPFMDGLTLYDHSLYKRTMECAKECNIPAQPKTATSGGTDAGSIHLSRSGVRTVGMSLPCRYIHSRNALLDVNDLYAMRRLAEEILRRAAKGEI